jgi:hypothetical protein
MAKIAVSRTGVTKTGGAKVRTSSLQNRNSSYIGTTKRATGGASVKVRQTPPARKTTNNATKIDDSFPTVNIRPL